ncbi:MAG: FtsQ-type POTRA domain-containing protein [Patescibacteria group bacterium]
MVIRGKRKVNYTKYKSSGFISGINANKEKGPAILPKNFFRKVIIAASCLVLIYSIFFSSKFKISEVIVEGSHLVPASDIEQVVPRGSNIFFLKNNTIERDILKKFPEIQAVQIYRGIPDALKVVIVERDGKLLWQTAERKYLVSSEGEVMRETADNQGNLPLVIDKSALAVETGDRIVSSNFVAFVTHIFEGLEPTLNIKPLNFEITETTFDVNLHTDTGFYIKFNSLRSSKKQLENAKLVLVQKRPDIHEYIDIRVDGWAYYK